MKKTNILVALTLSALTGLFTTSCKKNNTGGMAELHAHISHHTTAINSATVYVTFDATTAPADPTKTYDVMAIGESTDNHVHIEGLRPGNYYLYAVGYDNVIKKTVKGGTSVEIKWKDRKEMIDVDIDVME